MGLFDKIKSGFKKVGKDIKKSSGHISNQIKKGAYKAGDAIKDSAIIVGDEVKDAAIKTGDVIKDKVQDPEFQRTVANVGFTAAEILAPEFAPELMMGQMAVNALIESKGGKEIPYNTMLSAGTAYASGDFKKRGSSNKSISERFGELKNVAIEEGGKQVDYVKNKLTDEAKMRYENVKGKVTARLGFDPTEIKSTDDALNLLKAQIDKNKQLEQQLMDLRSGKALENLTNKAKSELKKEVKTQGNKILNDVLTKVSNNKNVKKVKKTIKKVKKAKSKMDDVLTKVKQNQQRFRYNSRIRN